MHSTHFAILQAEAFCQTYGLRLPILVAPMTGVSPASLAIAVGNGGALDACGALLMQPQAIRERASTVRANTNSSFADTPAMLTHQKRSAWSFELEAQPFGENW